MRELVDYATDPVAFIDDFVQVNELGRPFHQIDFQRELTRAAYVFDAHGRLPWDTFLDARIKKSSKTTDAACRVVHWAFTQEAPNELYVLANDLEQSQARVFATVARLCRNNPALAASVVSSDSRRIVLTNGTVITALASEYAGAAGSNHGFTSWDELWAYTSEASTRLWEELTPVPTRRNSIRNIGTYAGWEAESTLLWALYLQGVGPEEHPDGEGARIHPTLPLYLNRAARLLTLWDHERRFPWQLGPDGERYYRGQQQAMRGPAYLRVHENRWGTAESAAITPALWDACVYPEHAPLAPSREMTVVGAIDAAPKHDSTGIVWLARDGDLVVLVRHLILTPKGGPLDFAQIDEHVRWMAANFRIGKIVLDPYQMHSLLMQWQQAGLPAEEFVQSASNLTRAAETVLDLLRTERLALYADGALRSQALNATIVESPRGIRLAKPTAGRKIDAAVALGMAAAVVIETPEREPARLW